MIPSEWLRSLTGHYPAATHFSPGEELSKRDSRLFAALWLSEGIPFAFLQLPAIFQAAREQLASRLVIPFRDISMTGSGRIGYSMSPEKFGSLYSDGSDIDLFVISAKWFSEVSEQTNAFLEDYKNARISPGNDTQKKYWDDGLVRLPRNIDQGFVDPKKIPSWRYPVAKSLQVAADQFQSNVNMWSEKYVVKSASIRVYRDWGSAVDQIAFNLRSAIKHRTPANDDSPSDKGTFAKESSLALESNT